MKWMTLRLQVGCNASRFESHVSEWAPLCQALLDIPHLLEACPDLASLPWRALAGGGDNVGDALVAPISRMETSVIFTDIKPDRNDDPFVSPPEENSDKILFPINNLALVNVTFKLEDMRVHFKKEHAQWFTNYLVDQHISTEPNNHQLYLQSLDGLGHPSLF